MDAIITHITPLLIFVFFSIITVNGRTKTLRVSKEDRYSKEHAISVFLSVIFCFTPFYLISLSVFSHFDLNVNYILSSIISLAIKLIELIYRLLDISSIHQNSIFSGISDLYRHVHNKNFSRLYANLDDYMEPIAREFEENSSLECIKEIFERHLSMTPQFKKVLKQMNSEQSIKDVLLIIYRNYGRSTFEKHFLFDATQGEYLIMG